MAIATVENLLDIPIDYYVRVNMEGFQDIVDAVGGIQVNNNLEFTNGGHHYAKGLINLNGEQALSFVECGMMTLTVTLAVRKDSDKSFKV